MLLTLLRSPVTTGTTSVPSQVYDASLTWPREMPARMPFRAVTFEPTYQQTRAPTRGGLIQVANIGIDLWSARYETPPLHLSEALPWKAWLHSLRGGARMFKAWDPVRRYAKAYAAGYGGLVVTGGAAFDGTATLAAIATPLDAVLLTGLPASFKLGTGDLISFPAGTSQTLHEVISGGSANGSGSMWVVVEPTVPLTAVTGVQVQLDKPWFTAVVDARSIQSPWQLGRRAPVSFSATQVMT